MSMILDKRQLIMADARRVCQDRKWLATSTSNGEHPEQLRAAHIGRQVWGCAVALHTIVHDLHFNQVASQVPTWFPARDPKKGTCDRMVDNTTTPTPSGPTRGSCTTDGEWHLIHNGEEVGPFCASELIEKALTGHVEPDDLVKPTGGRWMKASDVGLFDHTCLSGHASKAASASVTDLCFFCGATPSESPFPVSLYKITKRTNGAFSCETNYLTTKVDILRCCGCGEKHTRLGRAFAVPAFAVIIGVLSFLAWGYWGAWRQGELTFGLILAFPLAAVLVSLLLLTPLGFLLIGAEMTLDACGINTERRCRKHPSIKVLLAEGWEIGDKPPYKGGDIQPIAEH